MKQTTIRVLRMTVGVALVLLGIVGLFLPFLQGVLFIVAGLALLGRESERVRRWNEYLREQWRRRTRLSKGESFYGSR